MDKETKQPIYGAEVRVDRIDTEIETETNALGYFEISADSIGQITVSHPEYEAVSFITAESKFQLSLTKVKRLPDSLKSVVFTVVDQQASFKGGESAMLKFFGSTMKMPKNMRSHGKSGEVLTRLLVSELGTIDSVVIVKSDHELYSLEACRVIKLIGEFEPGKKYGINVKSWLYLPIRFEVSGIPVKNKISDKLVAEDYYETALRYVQSNLKLDAIYILGRAVELNGRYTEAFFKRAAIFYETGNITEACVNWSRAAQLGEKQAKEMIQQYCNK